MARTLALLLAALLGPQQCSGAAVTDNALHRHRGRHLRHRRHIRAEPVEQTSSEDDKEDDSEAPLYDDFLDIMNNAGAKAISEQRAIPAYDDFLHFMKHSVEKAHKQQVGKPSYDEFLGFLKGKADVAYQQQTDTLPTPSYDDFLTALKASSTEALKEPVPTYEQFLGTLKDAATDAMQKRVHGEEHIDTVEAFKLENSFNPLDKMNKAYKRTKNQMTGKKHHDDEEGNKLREELRKLKEEKKRHAAQGDVPHHVKKPLMKRINVLRTQLCWKRPNLWQHEKCLRFLGIHCMKESTGAGICKAFTKKAGEKCKNSDDLHWKEDYCALHEALSDSYGEDEEEEEEEEEEDELEHDDDDEGSHEDGVGTDDDLDHELDEMDRELADHEDEDAKKGGPPPIKARKGADRDGDGVADDQDAFPDDATEWKDTDKDGIGDNADDDDDADGHKDDVDAFPTDPKEWKDSDGDGIGDNADKDSDNDGVDDDKDKFPSDPTEWFDSDGDGYGDNKDAYPFNPNCHDPVLPCLDFKGAKKPKPDSDQDPTTLDKDAHRPLPEQGYSEHVVGAPVHHENYYSWVGDWQKEFPDMPESEARTMEQICQDHPDNTWCIRFANRDAHFR